MAIIVHSVAAAHCASSSSGHRLDSESTKLSKISTCPRLPSGASAQPEIQVEVWGNNTAVHVRSRCVIPKSHASLQKKTLFLSCSQSKAVWHHHADGMAKAVTEMPKETL